MAQQTKIKKDFIGLYTICGGYISRPFFGTTFAEGDTVKTHHFGGSTLAGVTSLDKPTTHNFKRKGMYEVWVTTGISSYEYKDKQIKPGFEMLFGGSYNTFEEYLTLETEWYKTNARMYEYFAKDRNLNFKP